MTDVVPCVVFAFNRPDTLERVLAALRGQDIDRLIVFVDGPRNDADVELVEGSRAIAKAVDWVDRELHFGDQNRGLPGLSDNVSTVMSVYESAICVEDDCLPMPGFYSFMRRALSHYEPEKKVFSIGGYQYIPHKYFKEYPYSLVSCPGTGSYLMA
jgi:GT2 family glycosyltransferase